MFHTFQLLTFMNVLFSFITQAIINSIITTNMMFTKTSQKFGQWADSRANTVYGLGFGSEAELNKVRLKVRFKLVDCCYMYLCLRVSSQSQHSHRAALNDQTLL